MAAPEPSLLEFLIQNITAMTESRSQSMVLVYELRRDHRHREEALSQVEEQWQAYERGDWPVHVSEGRISKVFFYASEGKYMFELDEGARRSTWVRQGDDSWYVVGWRAKGEQVVFHTPPPVGAVPVVTRIWISLAPSGLCTASVCSKGAASPASASSDLCPHSQSL